MNNTILVIHRVCVGGGYQYLLIIYYLITVYLNDYYFRGKL